MKSLNEYINEELNEQLIEEGFFNNFKVFGKVISNLWGDTKTKVGAAAKKASDKLGKEWEEAKQAVEKAEQEKDVKNYQLKLEELLNQIDKTEELDDKEKSTLKVAEYLKAKSYAITNKNKELKKWVEEKIKEEQKENPDVAKEVAKETKDGLETGKEQEEPIIEPEDKDAEEIASDFNDVESDEVIELANKILGESLFESLIVESGKLADEIKKDENKKKAFLTFLGGLLAFTKSIGKKATDLPKITSAIQSMVSKVKGLDKLGQENK